MSNKGNIKASILLILLKCIVEGYSNKNESFTNRLFSNNGPLNMRFHIFRYRIYNVSHEAFVKKSMKKLSFFNSNFNNSFQDVLYYRKLECLTLWYWNGSPLNIRQKVEKLSIFWAVVLEIKNADNLNFSRIKYFGHDF